MPVPCRSECRLTQLPERLQAPAREVVSQEGQSLRELVDNELGPLAVRQVEIGRPFTSYEAQQIVYDCVAQCPRLQSARAN